MHSRILLSLLMVVLQASLLPKQGRIQCILRSGLLSCCCVQPQLDEASPAAAATAPAADDCCSHRAAAAKRAGTKAADPARSAAGSDAATCACESATTTPPGLLGAGSDNELSNKTKTFALRASTVSPDLARLAASKRVALRSLPPARTGPPLHVRYQVFLI